MQQLNNTIYIYQVSFRYGKFSCGYLKFIFISLTSSPVLVSDRLHGSRGVLLEYIALK